MKLNQKLILCFLSINQTYCIASEINWATDDIMANTAETSSANHDWFDTDYDNLYTAAPAPETTQSSSHKPEQEVSDYTYDSWPTKDTDSETIHKFDGSLVYKLAAQYATQSNSMAINDLMQTMSLVPMITNRYGRAVSYNSNSTAGHQLRILSAIIRAQISSDSKLDNIGDTGFLSSVFSDPSKAASLIKTLLTNENLADRQTAFAEITMLLTSNLPKEQLQENSANSSAPSDAIHSRILAENLSGSLKPLTPLEKLRLELANSLQPTAPYLPAEEAARVDDDMPLLETKAPALEEPAASKDTVDLSGMPESIGLDLEINRPVNDDSVDKAIKDQLAIQQINDEILPRLEFSRGAKSVLGFAAAHGMTDVLDYLLKQGPVKASDVQEGLRLIQGRGANGRTASGKKAKPEPWFDDIRAKLQNAATY
jgi:hypothetical protein